MKLTIKNISPCINHGIKGAKDLCIFRWNTNQKVVHIPMYLSQCHIILHDLVDWLTFVDYHSVSNRAKITALLYLALFCSLCVCHFIIHLHASPQACQRFWIICQSLLNSNMQSLVLQKLLPFCFCKTDLFQRTSMSLFLVRQVMNTSTLTWPKHVHEALLNRLKSFPRDSW